MTARKRGPARSLHAKRRSILIKLNEPELRDIKALARASNLPMATYVRRSALGWQAVVGRETW